MRIAVNIIIAVVSLAAVAIGRQSSSRSSNSSESSWELSFEGDEVLTDDIDPGKWMSYRESQMLLRKEGGEKGLPVDCCPSILEMVEPQGGTNQAGMVVVLYSQGEIKQRFYELSCREGVVDKPCRFMDRKLHNQSRCVQKYSYTYAIIQQPPEGSLRHHQRSSHLPSFPGANSNWRLDYIKIRSGCSCELMPRPKKKRTSLVNGKRAKPRRASNSNEDI